MYLWHLHHISSWNIHILSTQQPHTASYCSGPHSPGVWYQGTMVEKDTGKNTHSFQARPKGKTNKGPNLSHGWLTPKRKVQIMCLRISEKGDHHGPTNWAFNCAVKYGCTDNRNEKHSQWRQQNHNAVFQFINFVRKLWERNYLLWKIYQLPCTSLSQKDSESPQSGRMA